MIKVFAPASLANFFVGFDILGFCFDQIGDELILEKNSNHSNPRIELELLDSQIPVPKRVNQNTATVALESIIAKYEISGGFKIKIKKGIPLSSGLGGSAASAVAAVFAANELLNLNLSHDELIEHALAGEKIASGSKHADNIAPSLKGGMQLISSLEPVLTQDLTLPRVYLSIIHPHLKLETAKARAILEPKVELKKYIQQSQKLAEFILACERSDKELFRRSLVDFIIEPQRSHLIQGFEDMKNAALTHGAWSFSISGAGPSCLAVCDTKIQAEDIASQMQSVLRDKHSVNSDIWVSNTNTTGARIL